MGDVVELGHEETFPRRGTGVLDEAELYLWAKRQLGYSDVEVELTEENVKDALDEALATYSKFKAERVTESFMSIDGIMHYVPKTPGVRGIFLVQLQGVAEGITAPNIESQLMSGNFAYYGVAAPKMDLRLYEYTRQWIKIASRELSSEQDYHVSDDKRSVYIYSPGRVTRVTLTLLRDHVHPSTVPAHDQIWLRKFVKAYCKDIVGHRRGKYSSIPGANGQISMDGERLITEGATEMEKLLKDLERARGPLAPSLG